MPSAVFTKDTIITIKAFLDEFRSASRSEKSEVVKRAAMAVLSKNSRLTKAMRGEMRKVNNIHLTLSKPSERPVTHYNLEGQRVDV